MERHYARDEDEAQRQDRHWNELLQELRLAQTGTQILFAFLLAIAFTQPLRDADGFVHTVFGISLVLAAMATALLIGPVSFHRLVFQRRLRDTMVPIASWMANGGLFLLMLATSGSLLLALDVVMARGWAIVVSLVVVVWFTVFWYVIPGYVRIRR